MAKKKGKNGKSDTKQNSESSTAVATRKENLPATTATVFSGDAPEGLEDFDMQEDGAIPRIGIVQPTSKVAGTHGYFREVLSGLEHESLAIRILKFSKGRVMFSDDMGEPPLCRSNDNVRPDVRVENPPADLCARCPNSRFSSDGTPPACNKTFNLLALDDDGMPFWISFKSSALKPTKELLSTLNLHLRKKKLNLRDAMVTITTKRMEGKGVYYVPVFSSQIIYKPDPEADLLYEAFRAKTIDETYQEEEDKKNEDGSNPEDKSF